MLHRRLPSSCPSGAGSLRQAIIDANTAAGADVITFSTSGLLTLATALPTITGQVDIQGQTATGYAPGAPTFQIHSGSNILLLGIVGVSASGTIVQGLDFSSTGARIATAIAIGNANNVQVLNCALRTRYTSVQVSNAGNPTIQGNDFTGSGNDSNYAQLYLLNVTGLAVGAITNNYWGGTTPTLISFNGYAGTVDVSNPLASASCAPIRVPEINVLGNAVNIVDGDASPTTADHTDFGNVAINAPFDRVFTIQNQQPGSLVVTGITITGAQASEFVVSGIAFPATIAGNSSATFTVTFTPTALGIRNAIFNIASNDCDETPYNVSIRGTGVNAPEMRLQGNATTIVDGDVTPITADHTDFGSVVECTGATVTRTFTIQNQGNGASWGTMLANPSAIAMGSDATITFTGSPLTTGFSQFVIVNSGSENVLPIELLAFEATRISAEQVKLDWRTASEWNNADFEIERMLDDETAFQTIGFVEGYGTSNSVINYGYRDDNAYPGVSYYRLRQVDFDGKESYSEIRAVAGQAWDNSDPIILYPNPTDDNVYVRFGQVGEAQRSAQVVVMNMQGAVVQDFTVGVSAYGVFEVAARELPSGAYMVNIVLNTGEQQVLRFIRR